jgi:glycosyltransferase domain-containing protein
MEKVALLVPTKDRLKFVIRLINYYASINSQHPIFIGDASGKSYKEEILKASNGKLEIYYFHWKNLNERKTTRKLAEQVQLASISDYCVCNPDDDFFVLESLSMCAEFLSKNPEYSTSQGRAFIFELETNDVYGELKDIGIYWDVKELNGDTAIERLREISSNYWVPIFSVHRTGEFIEDTSNGIDSVLDRGFGEYANSLSFALRGKSKFIDCLYLARSTHNQRNPPLNIDWITKDNWYLSYTGLINSMSTLLSKNDNLSLAESNSTVKLAINRLLKSSILNNDSLKSFIIKKYSEYLGKKSFVYMLSRLYRKIKSISIFPCKNFSKKCLMSNKSKYYKDVSSIIDSCKKKDVIS